MIKFTKAFLHISRFDMCSVIIQDYGNCKNSGGKCHTVRSNYHFHEQRRTSQLILYSYLDVLKARF